MIDHLLDMRAQQNADGRWDLLGHNGKIILRDLRELAQETPKSRARAAVQRAEKQGVLTRPDACQECGARGRVQAHHGSYEEADWLEVDYLCPECHAAEHLHGIGDMDEQQIIFCFGEAGQAVLAELYEDDRPFYDPHFPQF